MSGINNEGQVLKKRQYSVKIYDVSVESVEDITTLKEFLNANYLIFRDHLIVLRGEVSQDLREYLAVKSLYFLENVNLPEGRSRKELENDIDDERKKFNLKINMLQNQLEMEKKKLEAKEVELEMMNHKQSLVHDKMLRSGQELDVDGDLIALNKINSGASIDVRGNFIAKYQVHGSVRCTGRVMILSVAPKANIVFHGLVIETYRFQNTLCLVELNDNIVSISPLDSKDNIWAK